MLYYSHRCSSGFKVYSPLAPAWSCLLLAKLLEAGQEARGTGAAWGTSEAEVAVVAGAEAGRAAGGVEGGLSGGVGSESWNVGQELASLIAGGPQPAELAPWGCGDEAAGCNSGDSAGTARE